MADSFFKKIDRKADRRQIIEYCDYLTDRLSYILENIGEENLCDELNRKIRGESNE
ncbi:MAG: hypothetical protein IKU52_05165 [Clostridia bacterium]|nr:hypothetical protein [Clostridia bacterium]